MKGTTQPPGRGPGGKPLGPAGIIGLSAYLGLLAVGLLWALVALWPADVGTNPPNQQPESRAKGPVETASPEPAVAPSPDAAELPGASPEGQQPATPTTTLAPLQGTPSPTPPPTATAKAKPVPGNRLLLLVLIAGALGGVLHAIRSTYWYVGNRNLVSSWVLMYFLLPVVGAVLAPLFYLVVRGGLLVVQAETDGYIGFVAIAGLTGLFSQQATLKLKKIAEQFFSRAPSGSDATPQGGASASTPPPPSIASILPARPTASPNPQPVTLAGSGFAPPLTVTVTSPAGQATTIAPGKVRNATPTSLDMDLTLDPPGDWTLTVANGDGRVSPAFTLTVI